MLRCSPRLLLLLPLPTFGNHLFARSPAVSAWPHISSFSPVQQQQPHHPPSVIRPHTSHTHTKYFLSSDMMNVLNELKMKSSPPCFVAVPFWKLENCEPASKLSRHSSRVRVCVRQTSSQGRTTSTKRSTGARLSAAVFGQATATKQIIHRQETRTGTGHDRGLLPTLPKTIQRAGGSTKKVELHQHQGSRSGKSATHHRGQSVTRGPASIRPSVLSKGQRGAGSRLRGATRRRPNTHKSRQQPTMSGLLNKLKKNKTPDQLVAAMVEALDQGQDAQLAKRLSQIKFVLYGEEEREPDEARHVQRTVG